MAVGILEAAAIHKVVVVDRRWIEFAAGSLRLADHLVDLFPAVDKQAKQSQAHRLRVSNRLAGEMPVLVGGHQHDLDRVRKYQAGRGVVAELRVPSETDRFVKRGRPGDIADRQTDEDHFGHRGSFQVRPKDGPAASIPTVRFEKFGYVAIGFGMLRNARVTCQNSCRLMASATECAVPGRMMNWRSPFGSLL